MSTPAAPIAASGSQRLAHLVTQATAPTNLALGLLVGVAWHSSSGVSGAAWGALAGAFASLLPLVYILLGVRRGRWRNRHVPDRAQRWLPLLVAAASVSAALVLLIAGDAPRPVVALLGAMLAGLGLVLAITLVWKVSIHTAVASGTAVVVAVDFGVGWLAIALPLLGLVCWARVRLGEHTAGQVLAGAAAGAIAASLVAWLQ
jgi:membrane-associated phospholipid phosphatase